MFSTVFLKHSNEISVSHKNKSCRSFMKACTYDFIQFLYLPFLIFACYSSFIIVGQILQKFDNPVSITVKPAVIFPDMLLSHQCNLYFANL